MINNYNVCSARLCAEYLFANLFEWFVLLFFWFKTYLIGSHKYIVAHCVIADQRVIIYRSGLEKDNPFFFHYLSQFSQKYQIAIKEDQRRSFVPVIVDRRVPSLFAILLSCILFSEVAVAADTKSRDAIDAESKVQDDASLVELMDWVRVKLSRNDINVDQEIPMVKRLSRKELYAFAFGTDLPQTRNGATAQVYGLYDYKNETIYILDSVDISSVKGKSILLHELVHYLQYRNGYEQQVECKNQLEYMAYYLEASYLKEHGRAVSFTPNHLRRVAQCHG